jgi:mono/diheme cytochrome c family protein
VPPRLRTKRSRRRYVARVFLALLGLFCLLAGAGLVAVWLMPLPDYPEVTIADPEITATPERIERGAKLVAATCATCHASAEDPTLAGRPLAELPSSWGKVVSANLTSHKVAGISTMDDAQLVRALRTGVGRNGEFLPPWMPRYPRMADEDLAAIVAFLRSEDPWVEGVSARPGKSEPSFLVKLKSLLSWRPAPPPLDPIELPSRDDPEALGAYLVEDVLQCNVCHGSKSDVLALDHAIKDPGYLGGGIELTDVNGKKLYGTNITYDDETGIGKWTFEEFKTAMVQGARPDGTPLKWPMPHYLLLDDVELAAIFAYLANVPPVERQIEKGKTSHAYLVPGQKLDRGRHLFFKHGCYSCHGARTPHGLMRDAAATFETDETLIEFIRAPGKVRPRAMMPSYDAVMDEEELRELAVYVRSMATAEKGK